MKGGGSMKNFEVIKLNNSEYDYMVIATTCISPISTLTDIQNELEDKSGRIIFDLTLINGTSSNRYITASFENGAVNRRSFEVVKVIESKVEFFCSSCGFSKKWNNSKCVEVFID